MEIQAIQTRPLIPPQDDLYQVLEESLPPLGEKSVVVITSKVVAIHQGRCVPQSVSEEQKYKLAEKEADWYVPRDSFAKENIMFTRKKDVMIASAGIDKSNGKDYLVLWPDNILETVREIYGFIKDKCQIKELGVIITDSHVVMMRAGVLGVSIGHFGFNPVRNYIGQVDIFGRPFQFERTNVVDSLAVAAVLEMGEGNETTPLAVITGIGQIEFTEDEKLNLGTPPLSFPMEEDLFYPMLKAVPWKKGQGGLSQTELKQLQKTKVV